MFTHFFGAQSVTRHSSRRATMTTVLATSLGAALLTLFPLSAKAQTYTYTALSGGTASTRAFDINDAGEIVGASQNTGGPSAPAYWSSYTASATILSTPSGASGIGEAYSISQKLTGMSTGYIAGRVLPGGFKPKEQPAFWSTSSSTVTLLTISTSSGLSEVSAAYGVNTTGNVGGTVFEAATTGHYWSISSFSTPVRTEPAPEPKTSAVFGINENDIMVGHYWDNTPNIDIRPAIFTTSSQTTIINAYGSAYDINNNPSGYQVVGYFADTSVGADRAFIWDSSTSTTTTLPPVSGYVHSGAYGVNDAGDVVGYSADSFGVKTATIWYAGTTTPVELSTTITNGTYTLSEARSINNDGHIVGFTGSVIGPSTGWYLE